MGRGLLERLRETESADVIEKGDGFNPEENHAVGGGENHDHRPLGYSHPDGVGD